MVDVNAHLHTPWSFSAFDSVAEALEMAAAQGVRVVGINDFNTTDGYDEWREGCRARRLFPLFGIEMIALDEEFQQSGVRVNDPANPGRIYISGKGLACPARLPEPWAGELAAIRHESNIQTGAMCARLNGLLADIGAGFSLDVDRIMLEFTRGSLRERHLAKALRLAVWAHAEDDKARRVLLERIFGGRAVVSSLRDNAGIENEIRANLLKAGGAAFVREDARAFPRLEAAVAIIEAAGGMATYPFLTDDARGAFTDFESDLTRAAAFLRAQGIHGVEFISSRGSVEALERYAGWLWEAGFVVTLGSEHNTPAMEPIVLHTVGGGALTKRLKEINYAGACVVAAHSDEYSRTGLPYDPARRDELALKGDKLIRTRIDG